MSTTSNEYLISTFGDVMLDRGFTSIPNTLIYYRRRLGLTASEFEFIIAIISLSWKQTKEIRDKDIRPDGRAYDRQRKSLLAKGYLSFKSRNIYKENRFVGTGTIYNLSGLKKAIEKLVEEDRALRNMDCPVEQIYDEPSLFGDEINTQPMHPKKLMKPEKTEKEKKEENEEKDFLMKYNELHKELLGDEVNYKYRTTYKKYLLEAFKTKKNKIEDALKIAKELFVKLPIEKYSSLKLQDFVKIALQQEHVPRVNKSDTWNGNNNHEDIKLTSIPNGIDKLNIVLDKLEKGETAYEAYKAISNSG